MTIDEAIKLCKEGSKSTWNGRQTTSGKSWHQMAEWLEDYKRLLEQESCEDVVSRQVVIDTIDKWVKSMHVLTALPANEVTPLFESVHELPSVTPQQKMGKCKDCKYFEYDSVAKVNGIPLIVAHEICERWGNGCKSKEDGYCFLFEPKMQEVEENEKT